MLPEDYKFIVSDIFATGISLYCNCFFYGFDRIEYFQENDTAHKTKIPVNRGGTVTLKELETGRYILYGISKNGTKTLKSTFDFKRHESAQSFLRSMCAEYDKDYLLQEGEYLAQLFEKYTSMPDKEKETLGKYLEKLAEEYNNLLQKYSPEAAKGVFFFQDNILNMCFKDKDDFTWLYESHSNNRWIENEKRYTKDFPLKRLDENKLYRIVLYDENSIVKYFYTFTKSKRNSDKAFQDIIEDRKKEKNNTYKDVPELTEQEDNDILLSMYNIKPKLKTLLPSPTVYYDSFNDEVLIDNSDIRGFKEVEPDIKISIVEDKNDFGDFYSKNILVTKRDTDDETETVATDDLNITKDGNYYVYYEDSGKNILSIPQFFRACDGEYEDINKSYNSFVAKRFERALYKTFSTIYQETEDWNICKGILDRYTIADEQKNTDIVKYLITNILDYEKKCVSVPKTIHCILKCDYDFFSDQDSSLGKDQVFKKRYGTHVIPKKNGYVKVIEIQKGNYRETYKNITKIPLEKKIDSDGDIFIFQNIDQKTKKVSEPVMYSSFYSKLTYFFGRTGVIIDGDL